MKPSTKTPKRRESDHADVTAIPTELNAWKSSFNPEPSATASFTFPIPVTMDTQFNKGKTPQPRSPYPMTDDLYCQRTQKENTADSLSTFSRGEWINSLSNALKSYQTPENKHLRSSTIDPRASFIRNYPKPRK
jgi:hypothetical protein